MIEIIYKIFKFFLIISLNFLKITIYFLSGFSPRNKSKWVLSAWEGQAFRGSNMYLFKYLKNKKNISTIWITKNKKIIDDFKKTRNDILYAYSIKGVYNLLTAKFIFCSHGLYDVIPFCTRGSNLFCINHVTYPIKKMSFTNYFQNLSLYNKIIGYLVSPFDHIKPSFEIVSSSRARNSALFLDNNNPKQLNRILPLGLPKSDYLIKSFNKNIDDRLLLLKNYFPNIKEQDRFVLFLPTWRGDKSFNLFQYKFDLQRLTNILSKNNSFLLINFHPFDEINRLKFSNTNERMFVSSISGEEITNLLCCADIFVTDYSSLFSDFLLFDREMIFVKFSHDKYLNERDFQITFEDLPGKIVNDWIEFDKTLNFFLSSQSNDFKKNRNRWVKHIYSENNDGKSCQRIVNFIQDNL